MLVYGPTSGGIADTLPGYSVTVWDAATWSGKSSADFAAFDVIVFGDWPAFGVYPSTWAPAVANQAVWAPTITGNRVVIGTDPDFHATNGTPAAVTVIADLVGFAAADPAPGPGLYVALSGAYAGSPPTPVDLLAPWGPVIAEDSGGGENIEIIASHPALTGLTNADLSNWGESTHEGFSSWSAGWVPLAMALDAPTAPYHAGTGHDGLVYILASGSSLVPIVSGTPTSSPTISPTWTASPTPSATPSPSPTGSFTGTCTMTPTISPTFTHTITVTATFTPTVTPTFTETPRPLQLKLLPPNPNPSSDGTWIPYFLSVDSQVEVQVWTVAGEPVRRLDIGWKWAGYREDFWDLKNEAGSRVGSGIFIYRVKATSAIGEVKQDFSKCAVLR